jgi:hypothetical protein
VHPPGRHFHHEQDIQPLQEDRINMKEIASQQPFSVGAQEGPPGCINELIPS